MNITHWIVSSIAIIISAYLIPGVSVTPVGALLLAVVLGLINSYIKPIVSILTLPITVVTLGIFSLIVNALFVILAGNIVPNFDVAGFWPALWFSILLSLVNAFFGVNTKKPLQG